MIEDMNRDNEKIDPSLKQVVEFLEKTPGVHGLTAAKVISRAELVRDAEWPGWVAFEMERHRPVLGPVSASDGPAAYLMTRRRYAYDPKTNKLLDLAIIGKLRLECDIEALAADMMDLSFECERRDDGRIICTEECVNLSAEVGSAEEAEAFGRSIPLGWNIDNYLDRFETYGIDASEQIGTALAKLIDRCCEIAGELAFDSWEFED
ncbi:MAG TPA: hypothetical protein PLA50_03215 [Bacteroidia bacterium]|nr:hypothetical protein [Bacteroidia bacterium]